VNTRQQTVAKYESYKAQKTRAFTRFYVKCWRISNLTEGTLLLLVKGTSINALSGKHLQHLTFPQQ
jgi:hypothetical protein